MNLPLISDLKQLRKLNLCEHWDFHKLFIFNTLSERPCISFPSNHILEARLKDGVKICLDPQSAINRVTKMFSLRHRVFSFSFSNPDLKIVTGTKATIQSFFSQIFMIQYYLLPSTGPVIVLSKCDLLLHPASIWMRLWGWLGGWVGELSRFFAAKSYSDKSRLFFTLYFRLCVCSAGYHATRQ